MTNKPDKLYIAVRADLAPGLQMAQVAHAAFAFSQAHPQITTRWVQDSNYVVIVSVPDEEWLWALFEAAFRRNIPRKGFVEPDIDHELTAVALYGPEAQKLCANLPLALRELVPT